MRKFIVSDLHGNGDVYDSIMAYLENISLIDKVELYINGDLIDRGIDSMRMLEDVKARCEGKGNIKVHYLGGNHELLMYQAYIESRRRGYIDPYGGWIQNGGYIVEGELDARPWKEAKMYYDYVGTLDVYKEFNERIQGKKILLVHSMPPKKVEKKCHLKISDNTMEIEECVWKREEKRLPGLFFPGPVIGYNDLGKDGYLVIRGHTPMYEYPFEYNKEQNWLNIDGGCTYYATGRFTIDHVPLVEVHDGKLDLLIFNHNNQILAGYYFDGEVKEMEEIDLVYRKAFLNRDLDNCAEQQKKQILEINGILNGDN